MFASRMTLLSCSLLLGACASTSDLEQTRAQLDQVNRQATARLSQIESRISNERLLEMVSRVDGMQAEVAKLRGDNEMLQYKIGVLEKRQNDLYADIDQRLGRFEGGRSTEPASSNAAAPAESVDAVQQAFDQALSPLRKRDFAQAVVALKAFADSNPNAPQALDATYWRGVAHTALRQYDAAIDIQRRFADENPRHPKAPDALRNVANAQRELEQVDQARITLKKLIKLYPNSDAAAKAKQQLTTM
ncbi:tol-pal system protein YbgF [Aquitalea sp. S1-19]|nr:tol-pal system protein YbgF [Aquitalea sp. S1-19]MCP9760859.1 tol-pal system protein YbgF [Aquitalea sp. S1-19]MCP9760977.1 tol-pal system protein YbgF [Aquitalea sp. S1-19]